MRVRITVQYDGRNYCGWQTQKNGIGVQQCLRDAIYATTGERVHVEGSGRTDAGVHAVGQVAHFDTATVIPVERLVPAINTRLPEDISVLRAERVDDAFHARFSAKRKTYVYRIYCAKVRRPLYAQTHGWSKEALDVSEMRRAADMLIGEHDFVGFASTGSKVTDTVRTIYAVAIREQNTADGVQEIEIEVTGNGFLYNMVRIIAGTLVYVGRGKLSADCIPEVLSTGDRTRAGKTLPPQGLYLWRVEYPEGESK